MYNILQLTEKNDNTESAQYSLGYSYRDEHPTKGEGVRLGKKNPKSIGNFQCSCFWPSVLNAEGCLRLWKEVGLSLAAPMTERAVIITTTETAGRSCMYSPADSLRDNCE